MGNVLHLHLEAFARLSQQDRALIERLAQHNVREIGPRRDVIREGDKPRAVNLMLDGWACRYKSLPDGRRQIVSFFIPGDLCDSNIFILKEMDHSIGAITRLRYAEISPTDFEELMLRSPRITQALWWNELVGRPSRANGRPMSASAARTSGSPTFSARCTCASRPWG